MFDGFREKAKEKMIGKLLKKLEEKAEKDPAMAEKLVSFVEQQRVECEKKGLIFDDDGNIVQDPRKNKKDKKKDHKIKNIFG